MPITTLEEAYSAGANRTVESLLRQGVNNISAFVEALQVRFGPEMQLPSTQVSVMVGRARESIVQAGRIESGQFILDIQTPINSAIPSQYQYTVLAEAEDTSALGGLGATVRIPVTVNSDSPLTWQQIQDRATAILERGIPSMRAESMPGATGTLRDITRMEHLIVERLGGQFVGSFRPLTAYQRG